MILLWNSLPPWLQLWVSKIYTKVYNTRWSRWIIKPFCYFNDLEASYLSQFEPPSRRGVYESFQQFFTRKMKALQLQDQLWVWPCEGYVCQHGQIGKLPEVRVKGDFLKTHQIFQVPDAEIPSRYYFANVFLHNHNYHRIHAPVAGTIRRIQRVPGGLSLLRPWFYPINEVSKPAMRNERVNVDIVDSEGRPWYMSIVGGMAVGSIELANDLTVGSQVSLGEELAVFLLGSTCCFAAPVPIADKDYLDSVSVGESLIGER